MKNIFFTGTAGSGKSQLTSILSNWYQQEGKDVITVNLDPGVNNLPYGVDVDIRDYINLKDIMEKYTSDVQSTAVELPKLKKLKLPESKKMEMC